MSNNISINQYQCYYCNYNAIIVVSQFSILIWEKLAWFLFTWPGHYSLNAVKWFCGLVECEKLSDYGDFTSIIQRWNFNWRKIWVTLVWDIKYMVAKCALKCTYKTLASKASSLQNHLSSHSSSVVLCGPPVIYRTCCGNLSGEHSGSCGDISLCFHSFNCIERS